VSGFALTSELEALQESAQRLAARQLEPGVRAAEAAGRWPDDVLSVLAGLPLGGLDLPEPLGGVDAGALAKAVVLEALAGGDPGGLPAADQPGRSAGALLACPDAAVAARVAAACLSGDAQAALVVADPEDDRPPRLQWGPSWPALRWVWVSCGDRLRLLQAEPGQAERAQPVLALGFAASGGAALPLDDLSLRGEWDLPAGGGVDLRGRARLWAAAVAVGIAQAALDATVAYTLDRVVFGKPVAHHQGNAFDLAAAAARVLGARLATRDAAMAFDRDEPHAGFWATQAWLEVMDAAFVATDLGIQLLGGHGFIVDHLAEKRFREARMLELLAGGRDAAEADVAACVLDVPDPLFSAADPGAAGDAEGRSGPSAGSDRTEAVR
jgi:alkylation response protein AidB-like acyl-CoA dehydrogenase